MALNGYANALTKLNRHEEAVDAYDIVLAKQPEPETRSRLLRGKALAGSSRTDEAIEEFSVGIKALKAEQKGKKKEADGEDQAGTGLKLMATAHFERGNAYLAVGEHAHVIEDYDEAVALDPENVVAHSNRGTAYRALGENERAIEDYNEVVRINPDYAAVYNNRANAYNDLGQREKALEDYGEAIRLDPKDPAVYLNRGNILSEMSEFERAIEDYTEAIRIDPNYSDAYHNRGVMYHRLGQYEESERDMAKVAELRERGSHPTPEGS